LIQEPSLESIKQQQARLDHMDHPAWWRTQGLKECQAQKMFVNCWTEESSKWLI